jgi:predicted phage gp36 major capsid-like protein
MEETTPNDDDFTRTQKGKMKAPAVSVDSDTPDTDEINLASKSESSNADKAAEDLCGELDEVRDLFHSDKLIVSDR